MYGKTFTHRTDRSCTGRNACIVYAWAIRTDFPFFIVIVINKRGVRWFLRGESHLRLRFSFCVFSYIKNILYSQKYRYSCTANTIFFEISQKTTSYKFISKQFAQLKKKSSTYCKMSAITKRNDIRFLLQCLRIFNVTPLHAHLSDNHTLRKLVEACSL